MVLAQISLSYSIQRGRSPTCYSPVRHSTHPKTFSCDLHVLSVPPAFVLSQDQTLRAKNYKNRKYYFWFFTVRNLSPLHFPKEMAFDYFFHWSEKRLSYVKPQLQNSFISKRISWDLSHLDDLRKFPFLGQNLNFIKFLKSAKARSITSFYDRNLKIFCSGSHRNDGAIISTWNRKVKRN